MKNDISEIRSNFPMYSHDSKFEGHPLHYLDNAATTFKPRSVINAINHYYQDITANTHRGDYPLAYQADVALDGARKIVADFINADIEEVCFTSGDTMAMNQIAFGLIPLLKKGDEIVLSFSEHASNALPWFRVAKMTGAIIKYIPLTKEGRITEENYRQTLSERTKIVSLASVSNVLGYLLPIKKFASIAHSFGALYIDDGAQSVPHMLTDVKDSDVDFLCFSGHKMCGPTGIGVMYGKKNLLSEMEPLFLGGEMNSRFNSSQEMLYADLPLKFEAGTQNIAGIIGLGEACNYLKNVIGFDFISQQEKKLKTLLVKGLLANGNCTVYNPESEAGIVTFNIKDFFAQDAASYLGYKGVFVRSGQHCAKILPEFLKEQATVRASLYFYNDEDDVEALIEASKHGEDFLDVFFN